MKLAGVPRAPLGIYPTPLERMERLEAVLGGPGIFIKRDDLTGLAMGGSKVRSLEYLIGDALTRGADTVITCGPIQSNHARLTAASARRYGLHPILVLKGVKPPRLDGNLLLDSMLGAELIYEDVQDLGQLDLAMEEVARRVVSNGSRPYVIPGGGYSPLGALGYVRLVIELCCQALERSLSLDGIVFASGSGCAQSGLLLGAKACHLAIDVVGLTINRAADVLEKRILEDVMASAELIGLSGEIGPDGIVVLDDYLGRGYAVPTVEGMDAIALVAETEGIILDPVYTGKAMAGLIDLVKKGRFKKTENVVFLHTGGLPGVFSGSNDPSART